VAGRLLASLLYGVVPADAGVIATSLAIVFATGLVGCLVPARRASRVDVVATLRQE
jgi:ABC-type antimicrobial peptide transport system permease subunit